MSVKTLLGAALAIGLGAPPLHAREEPCAGPSEAIAAALVHDARVGLAAAGVDEASAGVLVARAESGVQVSAFARSGVGDGALADNQTDNRYGMRLSRRVLDFGQARSARRGAAFRRESAAHRLAGARLDVAFETASAALDLARAEERYVAADRYLGFVAADAALVTVRLDRRAITQSEASRILADHARAQAELIEADRARSAIGRRLLRLTGQFTCVKADAIGPFLDDVRPKSLAEAQADAAGANPLLRALQADVEEARAEVQSAARSRWPAVELSATGSRDYDDVQRRWQDRDRVGFDVTMPIYQSGRGAASVAMARARLRAAQAELGQARAEQDERVATLWTRGEQGLSLAARHAEMRARMEDQAEAVAIEVGFGAKSFPEQVEIQGELAATVATEIDVRYAVRQDWLELAALVARQLMDHGGPSQVAARPGVAVPAQQSPVRLPRTGND